MLTAVAVSTMLVIDAWFDVTTAPDRKALAVAILLALCFELPGAFLSMVLARHAQAAWIADLFGSVPPDGSASRREPSGPADPAGAASPGLVGVGEDGEPDTG
jgi:hypothetical protein